MLEKIVNQLQGKVRVRVVSGFPERILNLCGAQKLSFWNLRWESPTEFTCELSRQDWYRLRRAAKKLDCTLTLEKKAGVPFFLGRFRRRHVLLAGLCLCGALLFFGSFFIWDFTIEGNDTVSDEEILRALQENGITIGTFGFSVDAEDLRNHVLLEIPELSWITVNVSGCQAHVQVRERIPAPELANKRKPTNVVAAQAGLILKVQALDGQAMVLPGTTVEKGQILISGVVDTDTKGARILAGMGKVYARTWYRLTTTLPLTEEKKVYGREETKYALDFGTTRIKFYRNSSIEGKNYDKITTRRRLTFFGIPLPVIWVRESYHIYVTEPVSVQPAEAEAKGKRILTEYLNSQMGEEDSVSSTLCSSRQKDGALVVTLTAECKQQIGKTVDILTDTKD